ncbi:hypothetical protein BRARA_C01672 [Brassica rapa]|uniref:Uncharacterized protein n=1 Tax=Brassica campestris TaxID=3711 RepID=A0A398A374_BRACM|nr:hypothetical protein BRARA_C01672 [Brassica rapa]
MNSFHLPFYSSIYKALLISYVSVKIDKILLNIYLDGTQRQLYRLHRPEDEQEDCLILRDCQTRLKVHCFHY